MRSPLVADVCAAPGMPWPHAPGVGFLAGSIPIARHRIHHRRPRSTARSSIHALGVPPGAGRGAAAADDRLDAIDELLTAENPSVVRLGPWRPSWL